MIRLRSIAAALSACLILCSPAVAKNPPNIPTPTRDAAHLPPNFPPLKMRYACADLVKLQLPDGRIIFAQNVPAGSFTVPGTRLKLPGLPRFCRVVGIATPTRDSLISFEVWIPAVPAYRQRYLQVGNGGFSGDIVYLALAEGIRRGYATASTDDGSQAHGLATFVIGHPEKVIDYGWRALKQTTDKAKLIIKALTGADPIRSYFHGCSNGGREALMEAQRFPDDFDGIAVGAPANYYTHQFTGFLWNSTRIYPAGSIIPNIPSSLLHVLSESVQAQCAGHDGGLLTDKFLNNPPACHVNLTSVKCTPGQDPATCFSDAQLNIVKAIYDGPVRDDASHARIYPGFEPGAESHPCNWGMWMTGKPTGVERCGPEGLPHVGIQGFFALSFFSAFVHNLPLFDIYTINFSSDIDAVDSALGHKLNAVNPDLHLFHAHGGKLIQYHGFDDAAVAPRNSINYWKDVATKMSSVVPGYSHDDFYRLFMAPGMSHCAGGPGASAFGNLFNGSAADPQHDLMRALEHWVEGGVAPAHIIAKHYSDGPGDVEFERPICPYPRLPHYDGGPETAATSWSCAVPP